MYQRARRIRCLFLAFCTLHKIPSNCVHFKNSANILTFHALNRNYYMDLNSLPYSQLLFTPYLQIIIYVYLFTVNFVMRY